MTELAALSSLHAELDVYVETLKAAVSGAAEIGRIETKQRLNDQAYFVLCWGQLETAIDDRCRSTIRVGRHQGDWKRRRSWQMFNPDDRRLSGLRFEDRVAFLLDRDAGAGFAYARVMGYYALRNGIAHGTLRPDRVDVQDVVTDFFQIQSEFA